MIKLNIDGRSVQASNGESILDAARKAGIYIPSLCYHPDLPSYSNIQLKEKIFQGEKVIEGCVDGEITGCGLCIVEVRGQNKFVHACDTPVTDGMEVQTNTESVREARKQRLSQILASHPHVCLTCTQKDGCSREPCSLNVPVNERCCDRFGNCELERIAEYIGVKEDTSRYVPAHLPVLKNEPLFTFDFNLCIRCSRCVRACQELRGVNALGLTYLDGEAMVGMVAPTLAESECRFCGTCVEVCPTGAIRDKRSTIVGTSAPCVSACPAGIDIPSYIRLTAEGKFEEADAVVREKVPFPRVLGYVCHHPCEDDCLRKEVNDAVAICALKRFVAGRFTDFKPREEIHASGKKVAIIGSGPAGLTVAYYLTRKGHSVTIFEASSELGGMLRLGILRYRLPHDVLWRDIDDIMCMGVEVKTNVEVGSDVEFSELQHRYNSIFVGVGSQKNRELMIEGERSDGVWYGLEFLKDVNLNREVEIGNRVHVIGGGDVAIDAARTALRLGAQVSVLYRRTRVEMPAQHEDVQQAEEEGVKFQFLVAPQEILEVNGHVTGIRGVMMKLGEPDENGRRVPSPIDSRTFIIETDSVIVAIGASPDLSFLPEGVTVTKKGTLKVDPSNMETSIPGVFAGGDVVTGPSSVVEAITEGRQAAASIDWYLGGDGEIDRSLVEKAVPSAWLGQLNSFANRRRVPMPYLLVEERKTNFALVELGYSKKEALKEAARCLQCDLRHQIKAVQMPPRRFLKLEESSVARVPQADGVYQLLNEGYEVIYIKGSVNMRQELEDQLVKNSEAMYFTYEEAKLFTTRENELLQQFLKRHGRLPSQNLDIEDLY